MNDQKPTDLELTNNEKALLSIITTEVLDCASLEEAYQVAQSWVDANKLERANKQGNLYSVHKDRYFGENIRDAIRAILGR